MQYYVTILRYFYSSLWQININISHGYDKTIHRQMTVQTKTQETFGNSRSLLDKCNFYRNARYETVSLHGTYLTSRMKISATLW